MVLVKERKIIKILEEEIQELKEPYSHFELKVAK